MPQFDPNKSKMATSSHLGLLVQLITSNRPAAILHFGNRDNFKLFDQWISNLMGIFTPSRAMIFDFQILLKSMVAAS
jgi:hypothetical protein